MKINRQTYLNYMTGGAFDRPLFCELFGPLAQLEPEWKLQGASADELNLTNFGFDYLDVHRVGINTGFSGGSEPVELERTDEYVITRDQMGRRVKMYTTASTLPLPLYYPLKSPENWGKLKSHYLYNENRFDMGWAENAIAARKNGELVVTGAPGGFAGLRELMGDAAVCMAYYDYPEMIGDILDTFAALFESCMEKVAAAGVQIDQLSVHEDLAGKSGPLLGPDQFEQFVTPYYKRIWAAAQKCGAKLFDVDSDGNINPIIDNFVNAGVNILHPLEPAAGMDMVEIHKRLGRDLGLKGGIDKMALREGKAAIDAELEYRLQPCMQDGGVVFGLDHRIPNGVHIDDYRYYVKRVREILGLTEYESGWGRMAF